LLVLNIGGEEVQATETHPFQVVGQGMTAAGNLKVGDKIERKSGESAEVESIALKVGSFPVYNLEVAGAHTYFVGQQELLVHNGCQLRNWISKNVKKAADDIGRGAKEVNVNGRSEAEDLFLGMFQGKGYKNTTGMTGREVRTTLPDGKYGTYHWDTADVMHGGRPHLQVHTDAGDIIRIFY